MCFPFPSSTIITLWCCPNCHWQQEKVKIGIPFFPETPDCDCPKCHRPVKAKNLSTYEGEISVTLKYQCPSCKWKVLKKPDVLSYVGVGLHPVYQNQIEFCYSCKDILNVKRPALFDYIDNLL